MKRKANRKANRIPYKRVLDQCDSLLVYRLPSQVSHRKFFSLFIFPKTEPRRFSEAIGNGDSEDVT